MGENLFGDDVNEFTPQVTALTLPQVAFAGERVNIRIDATAARGVSQLVLALRGAVVRDTTVWIRPEKSRVSEVVAITIPDALQDTLILVRAAIIDGRGDASRTREATVVVFGPPTVTDVSAPSTVRLGELISVRVSAVGARQVSQIDLVASGAIQKDTSVTVSPPRTNVTQDIVFGLPGTVQDTLITLSVGVRDAIGQISAPSTSTIPIEIEPPVIELTAPATANAGLDLNVAVHATSMRQISQIRLELRGAYVKDVSVPISPAQADVIQNISVPLPGDIITSDLRVRAAAVDRAGVVAYSSESNVLIPLGPPVVWSLEVPTSVSGGQTVDVRVRARGDRPLNKIEIRFRGAADATKTFVINPARTDVVQDASVTLPVAPADSVLVVMATATDLSGAVSEIVSQGIPLASPPAALQAPAPLAVQTDRAVMSGSGAMFVFLPDRFWIAHRVHATWGRGQP